ncbi:MAG: hypothetical protein PHE33_06635 [Bacteroidales bacterium]|nr:hypothetical protein [Bacteroidales bacterium]
MRKLRNSSTILLITGLLFNMSSCVVLVKERTKYDNGHHSSSNKYVSNN